MLSASLPLYQVELFRSECESETSVLQGAKRVAFVVLAVHCQSNDIGASNRFRSFVRFLAYENNDDYGCDIIRP